MRLSLLRAHLAVAATLTPLLVRLPLRWVLSAVSPPRWLRPYRGVSADRIAAAVERRLARPRMMRRRACLRRGLLLFRFLRLAGYEAIVHFAVFPPAPADALRGHCWVTLDGRAMSPGPDGPHAIVLTWPPAGEGGGR